MFLVTLLQTTEAVQETVRYTFKWGTTLPAWSIALLALFFFCWIYGCYRHEVATSSRAAKLFLVFFRWLVILALLAIICEPILQTIHVKVRKSYVAFLVDASLSMNIQDVYQKPEERNSLLEMLGQKSANMEDAKLSRIDIVHHLLSQSKRLPVLKEECELRYFAFDTDLTALPNFKELEPNGAKTNIYDNLVRALELLSGRNTAAVFVLTDGQHNTGRKSWQQAAEYAKQKEIPIYPVGVGSLTKKRDIVLAGVEAPDLALVDDKVRFEVEIKHVGYEGEQIPVYLKWGESLLSETTVTLGKEDEIQKAELFHTFHSPDEYQLTVLIPEQVGEFTTQNNSRQHNIKIIQQKLKVLYVEGPPRWEYRYLKNALVRDDTMLAQTWLVSADEEFPQDKSRAAPTLMHIPKTKEELYNYHCILLGDVSPESLGEDRMKLMVDFVKDEGGGVGFIAGSTYNPSQYWGTPLASLLPVMGEAGEDSGPWLKEQRLRLTPEGKLHPIMRLTPNAEENIQLWEHERDGLRGFYWYFAINKIKPGATVLALHATRKNPLMVSQFYGRGKTFFTAFDESWRWRFLHGDRYFYRFWSQVIRHIAMGLVSASSRKYHLRVDNTQYTLGEMVNILLRIQEGKAQDHSLPPDFEVSYKVPGGDEEGKKLKSRPNEAGTYEGSLIANTIGTYKVWLKGDDGKEVSTLFQVVAPMAETENTQLNEADLSKLAQKTNGQYLKPYELEKFLARMTPEKETIPTDTQEQPLWDRASIFWLLVGLLTIEWVVRKLCRML